MANEYTPLDLTNFDISETTGFVKENALRELPGKFKPWSDLVEVLHKDDPDVNQANYRQMVNEMPILDHSSLTTDEAYLAHAILSYCAHSYVWRYEVDTKVECLPASLSIPWKGVSDMIDLLPVISYSDVVLANIQQKDIEKDYTLDNLVPVVFNYPGHELLLYTTLMEIEFATALKIIVLGDRQIYENNDAGLTQSLWSIHAVLKKINAIFPRIHDVKPWSLFNYTLRLLKAWGKPEDAPYQDGLVYEGVSDEPMSFLSLSAAQSAIFQVLDAFLGIVHSSEQREHFLTLRKYMSPGHRRFIDTLEAKKSALTLVEKSKSKDLSGAYNGCIDEICNFRTYHAMMVNKYVNKVAASVNEPYSEDVITSLKATRNTTTHYKVDED